jgi:hypothetical protein
MGFLQDLGRQWGVGQNSFVGQLLGLNDPSVTNQQDVLNNTVALARRGAATTSTPTPQPAEQAYRSPTTVDIADSLQNDWQRGEQVNASDWQRWQDALSTYRTQVDQSANTARSNVGTITSQGRADADTQQAAILSAANVASTAAQSRLDQGIKRADELLTNSLAAIKTARTDSAASLQRVRDDAGNALSEFRDQSVKEISSWSTGFTQQTEQAKKDRASQLAQQGYSPQEVQSELRKMDWDAGVQKTSKVLDFQVGEQQRGDALRYGYNQLISSAETTASNISASMSQLEVGANTSTAATTADLQAKGAQVDMWAAGVEQSTRLGVLDAKSRYDMAGIQAETVNQQMTVQGYSQWMGSELNTSQPWTPYSSVLMSVFGLNTMLEDRNAGYEGGGISMYNTGLGMWQGAVNSTIGQVRDANTSSNAMGML